MATDAGRVHPEWGHEAPPTWEDWRRFFLLSGEWGEVWAVLERGPRGFAALNCGRQMELPPASRRVAFGAPLPSHWGACQKTFLKQSKKRNLAGHNPGRPNGAAHNAPVSWKRGRWGPPIRSPLQGSVRFLAR